MPLKILLVKPNISRGTLTGSDFVELEPLELEYLAAGIPQYEVRLIDMRFENNLDDMITAFRPDIVASTAYSVHFYNALKIMRTAKRLIPEVFTVVGGHHATLSPFDFNCNEIDAIVLGEGVFSFRELVENFEKGLSFENIHGLAIRNNGNLLLTRPRNDIEYIDLFPLPDRNVTEKYRKNYFYLWWRPAALLRASAGCAYRCSFCPIWAAANGMCVYRSPELVAEELHTIKEGFVYFCDDNAFYDSEKMAILCQIIKRDDINKEYFFFSRPDAVVRHAGLVEKWAEVGLRQVFIGVEAIEAEKLKDLHKNMEDKTTRKAVHILKENGIDPFAGFMVFPDFTEDDFDRILDYMDESGIYYNEVTVLTPAPGSDLYMEKKESLITEDYELFDYLHSVLPTALPQRKFYRNLANLYIRSYSPLRALRIRPSFKPSLSPGRIIEIVRKGLRNYLNIKKAWKSSGKHHL